jgi:isocitrate dehydrogenase (NAD+)
MIIRDNLEGEYSGIEHEVYPGVFESLKIITKAKASRVAHYAFESAVLTGRKKVTAVHKANIMKMADGLFLECTREAAAKFPQIKYEEMIVDNTCMQLTKSPDQFDVMVMPNLYGSIITSIGAGVVGGAGLLPGAQLGKEFSMFGQA